MGSDSGPMHVTISTLNGDPGDLLRRYNALIAQVPAPDSGVHLCLRGQDGIVIVDTCPSQEAHDAFYAEGGPFDTMLAQVGLPRPATQAEYPVHAALADGKPLLLAALPA